MASPMRKAQKVSDKGLFDSPTKRNRASSPHAGSDRPEFARTHSNTTSENTEGEMLDIDEFPMLGIGGFLDFDPRPTFVLDMDSNANEIFAPVFANRSFHSNRHLKATVPFKSRLQAPTSSSKVSTTGFQLWIQDLANNASPSSKSFKFCEHIWTGFKVMNHWLIIGGQEIDEETISEAPASPPPVPSTVGDLLRSKPLRTASEDSLMSDTLPPSFVTPGTPDWTLPQPIGDLSAHVIFARSVDWSTTPLGDMQTWSPEFRQVANLLMGNPHPAALFWGEELTVIYNKAYADTVAGRKHPRLMGAGFTSHGHGFRELWDGVSHIFQQCRRTGESVAVTDQMLPIERHGFLEETFFTWSLTPLYGGTSEILGMYNAPFETTRQTRNARATQTLLVLGQETALAQNIAEFWPKILVGLQSNEFDFPFALIYSVVEDIDGDEEGSISSESSQSMKSCVLEGTLGVPDEHPAAPTRLDLKRAKGGFIPSFRDAMQTREPKLLNLTDGSLSESLIEGIEWRGYGDPCREAIVCPVRPTNGENVMGFLVIGINPRRRFDEDYQAFIRLLDRQLATSLASVTLFEGEIKRGLSAAEAAAQERSRLSEELAVQKNRFQKMAELSPVGLHSITPEGVLLEANDRWFEMTGHPRDIYHSTSFLELLDDSSVEVMRDGWKKLTVDRKTWSGELKLKKPWYDPKTGEKEDYWILAAYQFFEVSNDGTLTTIMGSVTDITHQKRSARDAEERAKLSQQLLLSTQQAKDLQNKRLVEAEETRRAQNSFIDLTSHEMRNPLSAILQCADGISTSLKETLAGNSNLDPALKNILEGGIDSAETIQLCAQHQKSIVDDILTVSKLDSNLLLITPMPIQPVEIVQQALKMFVAECAMSDITMKFHVEESWKALGIDVVMLDSSRLLQVLINLSSNAIKFTKGEKKLRTIDVSLSAYKEPPTEGPPGFQYFPTNKARSDVTASKDWGNGEVVYLRFEVKDSGCGLKMEEMTNLFTRFTQASPRTHVKYGGSGLGLFISRQLAELQGGEIGVGSQAGVGSTFAFYIKARRSELRPNLNRTAQVDADLKASTRIAANLPQMLKDQGSASRLLHPAQSSFSSLSLPSTTPPCQDPSLWHVLIVEDNLVNQRILAQQIRKLGCLVHVANHGGEAIELIRQTKYYQGKEENGKELSIILMDLEMPVMDGLTCVRKIREMEVEGLVVKRLPIIAVTANARGEQIAAARSSGMDDVMPKPFRIQQLVPKIEALLLSDV